jgi:hypothetical protein
MNAERVVEKEKPNFCGYFILGDGVNSSTKEKDALKSAADALFKN